MSTSVRKGASSRSRKNRCCVGCAVFLFQAEDGIRDYKVTGVQTCALPILRQFQGTRVAAGDGQKADRIVAAEQIQLRRGDGAGIPGQERFETLDELARIVRVKDRKSVV